MAEVPVMRLIGGNPANNAFSEGEVSTPCAKMS